MAIEDADFVWRLRVYWEDTDGGGVVYYANYLKFMERARTEWLRACGVVQSRLQDEHGVVMVVRSFNCEYLASARLDDELDITVVQKKRGGASLVMGQEVFRVSDGQLLVTAEGRAACLDAQSWAPRRFPNSLLQCLS